MARSYLVTENELLSATVTETGDLTFTRDNGETVNAGNLHGVFARKVAVNVRDFGAACDGVTDDTVAVQDFFTYLGLNGGVGIIDGTMLLSSTIEVLDPAAAFTVRSEGGLGSARFLSVKAATANAFTFRGLKDTLIQGFSIDGNAAATTTHGISAYNCQNTTIEDVTVENYAGTGILFFKHSSFPGDSVGNRMVRCSAIGGGVAANGLLIEHSSFSGMYDCAVSGIDQASTPGYGLQLKNDCVECVIQGGTVDGAFAGAAFGYDGAAIGNQTNNVITGVIVRNCVHGLIGSRAEGNFVQLIVDMGGSASAVSAARLAGNFSNNHVEVGVLNPHASATVVTVQEDYNFINVSYVNALGTAKLADFAATSSTNTLNVGVIGDRSRFSVITAPITDAGSSNAVNMRMNSELHATTGAGSSLLRFTSPTDQSSYIQLSRSLSAFQFRALGSDVLYLTSALVAPGATNAQALGSTSRQYKEAWLRDGMVVRSPNGTAYRVGVTDAGVVTVTAA